MFNSRTGLRTGRLRELTLLGAVASIALASAATAAERAVVDSSVVGEQAVEFNVYLPLRDRDGAEALLKQLHDPSSASYHQWLTPAQFKERFGPPESTLNAITRELQAHGLEVTAVHTHSLHVSGTAHGVQSAFGAPLVMAHFASGRQVMTAASALKLTPSLQAAGGVIADFSGNIRMQATSRRVDQSQPQNRESSTGGYWFDDLKQAYSFPSFKKLTGKGVVIGILMEGNFNQPDMTAYFGHELLPSPVIHTVNIAGGAPFSPGNSFETHLDIQQSGGMAPNAHIILYNLPDLQDSNILSGLTTIIEDDVADVVNMSFSGPEAGYTAAYNGGTDFTGILNIYDDFFMEGNTLGITFVASSGDWGGLDVPAAACFSASPPKPVCGAMQAGIGSPASSPHVTAVGGTNLITTFNPKKPNDLNSAYVGENADDDPLDSDIFFGTTASGAVWGSGGGISLIYPKPSYQNLVSQANLPKAAKKFRTIPDLSLQMGGCPGGTLFFDLNGECPPDRSFVWEIIGGKQEGVIGTSASSPEFVGLLALKIQSAGGRLGNENFEIYALAAAQANGSGNTVFRSEIQGNNGVFKSTIKGGYNLVIGNGTLLGADFVSGPGLAVAGKPQTPSNP
ncbi:MAG TPA: S53 family serine peptidase [Steroidobacteraceae bacterium]|jgi:subtilase family serine protease